MKKEFSAEKNATVPFNNNVAYCVGTGRMGLALTKEYLDELEYVQKKIGFSFIRGHGLFCDDMAIYHQYNDDNGNECVEYNFTYLDRVVDSYIRLNIRPFIELGFMPYELASGTQTQFYWKGNVTPPKSYDRWCGLVKATLTHLLSRYGSEVLSWPVEVWNEPNLYGFWQNADMDEYFKLFTLTLNAVKEVNKEFKVGGPAICGGSDDKWMRGFLQYCMDNNIRPDFLSRHHYTTHLPERSGHYGFADMETAEYSLGTLANCRRIISEYGDFDKLPFYITEFNTSYIPNCPIHDTNQNAAYLAHTLALIGDYCTGYSYWTFGDVFEEQGVPFTLFHGGFGLVADHCIPKPTFWTFVFFKNLDGECVIKNDSCVVCRDGDTYKGILWNHSADDSSVDAITLSLLAAQGEYSLITKTVDEYACNPLKVWHDLGEPSSPDESQIELIRDAANPLVRSSRITAGGDKLTLDFTVSCNAVVYFELKKSQMTTDRGYSYERSIRVPYKE